MVLLGLHSEVCAAEFCEVGFMLLCYWFIMKGLLTATGLS